MWQSFNDGAPAVGVHRTATKYWETKPGWKRFQHFDGKAWGQVGLSEEEAKKFATEPTEFEPIYWQHIQ